MVLGKALFGLLKGITTKIYSFNNVILTNCTGEETLVFITANLYWRMTLQYREDYKCSRNSIWVS